VGRRLLLRILDLQELEVAETYHGRLSYEANSVARG
jgi:hypothetical protein